LNSSLAGFPRSLAATAAENVGIGIPARPHWHTPTPAPLRIHPETPRTVGKGFAIQTPKRKKKWKVLTTVIAAT
jgi:hypothetical protein